MANYTNIGYVELLSGGAGNPRVFAGIVDPSAGAGVPAQEGSLFQRFGAGAGQLWLKTGAADTAWTQLTAGSPAVWTDDGTNIEPVNAARVLRRDAGGNARGLNANDWQGTRSVATQVASGDRAVIAGGQANTASGDNSGVLCGNANNVSGLNAGALCGISNIVSGERAAAWGTTNQATNQNATAWGNANQATQARATAFGDSNQATAVNALAHGRQSIAPIPGAYANAAGVFAATGDAQMHRSVQRAITIDAAPVALNTDNDGVVASSKVYSVAANSTWLIEAHVAAARAATTPRESAGWVLRAVVDREALAATTAIVGSVDKVVVAKDAAAAAWDVNLIASAAGLVYVEGTGEAGKTIRWLTTIRGTALVA